MPRTPQNFGAVMIRSIVGARARRLPAFVAGLIAMFGLHATGQAAPPATAAKPPRSVGSAQRTLKAEFTIPLRKELPCTRLPDADGYAAQVGFSGDFWSARDPKKGEAWLTHCYGAVGVGRDLDSDSGGGTEL